MAYSHSPSEQRGMINRKSEFWKAGRFSRVSAVKTSMPVAEIGKPAKCEPA
jgi:hypothetical protein